MTTLSQDIRGALHAQVITAAGFPASNLIAEEGMPFAPSEGTTWAELSFRPVAQRPFTVGGFGRMKLHRGTYLVNISTPAGTGTANAEVLADAVRDVFQPGDRLVLDGAYVIIDYSERSPALLDAEWTRVPVTIGWRCFSSR